MNSNKNTTRNTEKALLKAARVAGLVYLLTIITNILSLIFVDPKLFVQGNTASTINNIMANELLFRIDVTYKIIIYIGVVILSVALYVILKTVNKNLALVALFLRFGEGIIGGVFTVLSGLIPLLLLNGEAVFETEQLQALVGLFLDVSSAALILVFLFLSLGSIVFFYLFFKSKYIPRLLSAFGIFSFLLTIIGTFINILSPFSAWMLWGTPTILFELMIGLWLLIKGINIKHWEKRALESA